MSNYLEQTMGENLLDTLHKDHLVIAKVLDGLDRQLELLRSDRSPDYELLNETMSFMADYPDRFHHPIEDVMFKVYMAKPPGSRDDEVTDQLRELLLQHDELIAATRSFRETLETAQQGFPVTRAELQEQLERYVTEQRAHLDKEEGEVFAALRAGLVEEDWREIDEDVAEFEEIKRNEGVEQRYQRMIDDLARA